MTNNQQSIDNYMNKTSYQDLLEKSGNFGRLHFVKRSIKEFPCRICSDLIKKGSICYRQNVYGGIELFPQQTRVCSGCASNLIKEGTIVVSGRVLKDNEVK